MRWVVLKLPPHSLNFGSACGGLPGIIVYIHFYSMIKEKLKHLHCVLSLGLFTAEAFGQQYTSLFHMLPSHLSRAEGSDPHRSLPAAVPRCIGIPAAPVAASGVQALQSGVLTPCLGAPSSEPMPSSAGVGVGIVLGGGAGLGVSEPSLCLSLLYFRHRHACLL